jgi:hypothetical protein
MVETNILDHPPSTRTKTPKKCKLIAKFHLKFGTITSPLLFSGPTQMLTAACSWMTL